MISCSSPVAELEGKISCYWTGSTFLSLSKSLDEPLDQLNISPCILLTIPFSSTDAGACPRLQHIAIHIGISDFFSDIYDPEHIREYQTVVTRLEVQTKITRLHFYNFLSSQICIGNRHFAGGDHVTTATLNQLDKMVSRNGKSSWRH